MDRFQWLLFLHVAGAFLVLGGAVMGGILNFFALRRDRPSDVVVLYRMVRYAVTSISIGMVVTIVFGLWLVADVKSIEWSDAWVIVSLLLWVLANALGGIGGRREKETRQLAERLAG